MKIQKNPQGCTFARPSANSSHERGKPETADKSASSGLNTPAWANRNAGLGKQSLYIRARCGPHLHEGLGM